MSADKRNGSDRLEQNIEKLLSRTPPERPLPPEAKRRILSVLTERTGAASDARPERTRGAARSGIMTWRRPESWVAAAAVVIVVGLIMLWPGGMQGGLAWADVARNLADAESVIAWAVIETIPPSGDPRVTRARLFQQDPGLSRTEMYSGRIVPADPAGPARPDSIDSIVITSRSAEESMITRLYPRERRARSTTLSFSGKALESRRRLPRDMVAEMFARLRGLTEDQTRIVGTREIDNAAAVGFAAKMTELMGDSPSPPPDGQVRVWASRETALPLEIEVEFRDPGGTAYRTTYGPIEWNAPLTAELFTLPGSEDWQVLNESIHEVGFFRTSLGDEVTLRIGPPDGPPVMTEEDVAAVLSARTILEPGETSPRTVVFLRLTPEGARRVHAYTAAHLGQPLFVDFNRETRYEIRIGGPIGTEAQIDISGLELSPEQFEAEYLSD